MLGLSHGLECALYGLLSGFLFGSGVKAIFDLLAQFTGFFKGGGQCDRWITSDTAKLGLLPADGDAQRPGFCSGVAHAQTQTRYATNGIQTRIGQTFDFKGA